MVAPIETVANLYGETVKLPTAKDKHPCFGQRQGWCANTATWRVVTPYLLLHFCDECKKRPEFHKEGDEWVKLDNE